MKAETAVSPIKMILQQKPAAWGSWYELAVLGGGKPDSETACY